MEISINNLKGSVCMEYYYSSLPPWIYLRQSLQGKKICFYVMLLKLTSMFDLCWASDHSLSLSFLQWIHHTGILACVFWSVELFNGQLRTSDGQSWVVQWRAGEVGLPSQSTFDPSDIGTGVGGVVTGQCQVAIGTHEGRVRGYVLCSWGGEKCAHFRFNVINLISEWSEGQVLMFVASTLPSVSPVHLHFTQ